MTTSEPGVERPVDLTDLATARAAGVAVEAVDALHLARLALSNFRAITEQAEELIRTGDLWPGRSAEMRQHQDGATSQARTAALVSIAESLAAIARREATVLDDEDLSLQPALEETPALVVVRPGDRILLTFRQDIVSREQAAEVVDAVRRKFPEVEVLAVAGVDVTIAPPLLDQMTAVGDDPEELGNG